MAYIGGVYAREFRMSTLRGCPCVEDGRQPCNSCDVTDPLLVTGIGNVVEQCEVQQYRTCRNGTIVSESSERQSCETRISYVTAPSVGIDAG